MIGVSKRSAAIQLRPTNTGKVPELTKAFYGPRFSESRQASLVLCVLCSVTRQERMVASEETMQNAQDP